MVQGRCVLCVYQCLRNLYMYNEFINVWARYIVIICWSMCEQVKARQEKYICIMCYSMCEKVLCVIYAYHMCEICIYVLCVDQYVSRLYMYNMCINVWARYISIMCWSMCEKVICVLYVDPSLSKAYMFYMSINMWTWYIFIIC